jgi:rod shape-determining protein MreC
MSANPVEQKNPRTLVLILLSQFLLMLISARHPNSDQSVLRSWVMAALVPAARAADGLVSAVASAFEKYSELRRARQENQQLRREIERLTRERDQARERAAHYEALKAQLALPSDQQKYATLAANVVSRSPSLWFNRLVIDRGELDGVKLNMPVAAFNGIVGRVISVGPNHAQVQIITDKHAGVGAMLQRSRLMGEVHGLGSSPLCEMRNVPSSADVQLGDVVVTSGLDGIYPKGLVIGTVERIEADPSAPWQRITLNPAAPIDRLEHVLVLLVEATEMKMQRTIK